MATVSPSAKVKLKASYPNYYTKGSTPESRAKNYVNVPLTNLQTTKQAAAYEAATGEKVYHAINGSFFDASNVARGHLIMEGNVFQPGFHTVQEPYFAVLKNGTYAIRDYTEPYYDVEEAIAARHWLVKNGKNVVTYGESTDHTSLVHVVHPRTAIGLKADGTVVTMIIDGRRDGYSVGVTLPLSSTFTSTKEVTAIRAWFNNLTHASGKTATFTIDYIAVGQASSLRNAPYIVKFVGADVKVLDTQTVAKGETVYYRGATPTKASDATNHYTFKGWNKTLTSISSNLTATA